MKNIIIFCLSLIVFGGCKKNEPVSICDGLLKQGSADKAQLLGQWEFAAFAFSSDGINIKNEIPITSCGYWDGTGNIIVTDSGRVDCNYNNLFHFRYSLSNSNIIALTPNGSTKINYMCQEVEIRDALSNAMCFAVKNKQLLIHYKEQNHMNILILNKNE